MDLKRPIYLAVTLAPDSELSNGELCKQPCARWAGTARKAHCKQPPMQVMGGAKLITAY